MEGVEEKGVGQREIRRNRNIIKQKNVIFIEIKEIYSKKLKMATKKNTVFRINE